MYKIIIENTISPFRLSDPLEFDSHPANNLHNRVDQAVTKQSLIGHWYLKVSGIILV